MCLEERGTVVLYGTAGGKVAPFDLEMLATGSFHVTRPVLKHYTATRSNLVERATAVFALVSTGQLKLRIERSYSLADAEQAHRDLNGRTTASAFLGINPGSITSGLPVPFSPPVIGTFCLVIGSIPIWQLKNSWSAPPEMLIGKAKTFAFSRKNCLFSVMNDT
jgi:hypothetical protein